MSDRDALLLERASRVRLLALDVDGVLTDGRLYFDRHGNELKVFHTRDGLGLRVLQRHGVTVALITGRSSEMVTARAAALGIEQRYRISFWDAMIVAAADRAGVETLSSEDFNHGQKFGRVQVVNPFT